MTLQVGKTIKLSYESHFAISELGGPSAMVGKSSPICEPRFTPL